MVDTVLGSNIRQETLSGLSKDIIVKVEDVIALVATEKNLKETRRAKKNMYIEDVSEFTRVLLSTTETSFGCGWRRTQLLFYTQLAVITVSRPRALLHLCYQDLGLRLIRDPEGGRPNLFIFLKPDFTKRFLGKKAPLHVCLLSMLFHIEGFKRITETGPVLDNAKKLYSVGIVDGLNQQDLKLKDEILNKYVFCQVERETTGYRIVLEKRMLSSTLRSQMRRVGEITTFEDIVKPYLLWYAAAKEFNNSGNTWTFGCSSDIMRSMWTWTPRVLSARPGLKRHWYDLHARSARPSTQIGHTSCRPKNLGPLTIFRRFVHGRIPSIDGNGNGTLKQPSMSDTVYPAKPSLAISMKERFPNAKPNANVGCEISWKFPMTGQWKRSDGTTERFVHYAMRSNDKGINRFERIWSVTGTNNP
ncbi:hypothetical protein PMAA_090770 [Talaromyces marneffei ATCC 18224]|uniref:Uncharacterized protein n=1 Tax=Talaromyces marneffei (strain ATCC 18224 / CBS 334.59 / QM 7333) TaxID=441960 RepID=B6QJD3_TALMQ|nr:hypothetical protein PMAA_090770 [Talaromyces marneffei ATCC 18224]